MCRLAAETLPFCQVDSYELEQKTVSYSIYTVAHFRRKFPDAALVLLVGSDMFLSFCSWYRWQDILRNVALGVVSREADDQAALRRQQAFLMQYGKIFLCESPVYPISSTKIRENCKNAVDFSCYLPKKVVQYIISHDLYQSRQEFLSGKGGDSL
ncbi:nicotinate (nicotinamide) nucleotide adenylyltransferase [uncultured Ruminococcus sp.]|nr:nicotinate (nicotinamide) nucleotide adenylyltransferase [uncultured Ruminococcus sp.]